MNTTVTPLRSLAKREITCRVCKAKPGHPCINQQGEKLRQYHQARLNDAKNRIS